jgi:uncharacterized membrane protein YuzA (DUF378 family)
MDEVAQVIVGVYILIGIASLVIIIYLISKRIEDKKREDFEDRDN